VANQYSSNLRWPYICCYIRSAQMLDMFYFIFSKCFCTDASPVITLACVIPFRKLYLHFDCKWMHSLYMERAAVSVQTHRRAKIALCFAGGPFAGRLGCRGLMQPCICSRHTIYGSCYTATWLAQFPLPSITCTVV